MRFLPRLFQRWWYRPKLVWPIQRARRKYDDSAVWSLDLYLAEWLPEVLEQIRDSGTFPGGFTQESWARTLDEMIEAFRLIAQDDYDLTPEQRAERQEKIDRGLALFAKWFQALWT